MAEEHCQIFPIMDLPAEVRTMIFKELLVMPSPILSKEAVYFQGKKRQGYRSKYPPFAAIEPVRYRTFTEYERKFEYIDVEKTTLVKQSSFLNLFLASKAIYREAMPIYFGCNVFEFDSLDRFQPFISGIGAEKRSQIRHLQVTWSTDFGHMAGSMAKLLYQCTALQVLTLRLNHFSVAHGFMNSPDPLQLWGRRELMKLRGLKELVIDIPSNMRCHFSPCIHVPKVAELGQSSAWWTQAHIDALVERMQVLKLPRELKVSKGRAKKGGPERVVDGEGI